MNFLSFLSEAAASEEKLKHLEHAEDHPINAGKEGYEHAAKTLHSVHQAMTGGGKGAHITTKYDGSPSIVFGHHPTTGKFFVASKSAFNKNPKLNYTPEDIEANHGHAPGLVEKLKHALKHLPKVAPAAGVYQGDVMHSGKSDVKSNGDEYQFKPNTITYGVKKTSPEGRKIEKAKFGLVVHTQYKGKDFESMKADFKPDFNKFQEHPDVHMIKPTIDATKSAFNQKTSNEFQTHMDDAEEAHQRILKDKGYDAIQKHQENLKTYINKTVRDGSTPSVAGYRAHVQERGQKDVDKLKTPAGKATRQKALDLALSQVDQHKKHLKNALELHGHLQKAKNTLINALEPAVKGDFNTYKTNAEGKLEPTKSEGSVVTINGRPTKLVDRADFSAANFAARPRPGDKPTEMKDKVAADGVKKEKSKERHGVMAFGRMNPPTPGHAAVAKKVLDVAKDKNATEHKIVVSASQDVKKNPLSGDQKVKHALRMFPSGTHVEAATKDAPTILHQAVKMHEKGITHLHVVAGSDRQKEMQDLLDKYNGKQEKHGHYNFKSITVHSSGERDPDAEGIEGMSASKMRELASSGKEKEFHKALPADMKPEHKKELYKDVRRGMKLQEMLEMAVRGITGKLVPIPKVTSRNVAGKLQKTYPGKSSSSGGGGGGGSSE